jgi:murein DD-endopeptidase MepM/ murein hydrolase activator NlpD
MLHSRYGVDGRSPRRGGSLTGRIPTRRAAIAALAAAVLVTVVPASDGAGAQAGSERARREAVRQQKAATAANLDALSAEDAVLEAAVAELNANVAAQEARVADARRATAEARSAAERIAAEAAATEAQVVRLEKLLRDRAVESYIGQGGGRGATEQALLDATNPTDLELRRVLIETVHGSDRDAIDQLAMTRQQLDRQRGQVAEAIAEAEAREVETQARLDELASARAEQQRLADALSSRIAAVQSEVAALAAEESNLTEIIRRAEAAAAAAARNPSGGGGASGPASVERPASASGLIWPTSGPVTSGYGMRWGAMHAGLDIAPPFGTPVYAANSGTVIFAGSQGGYGTLILIDHGGGFVTAYAHLSALAVGSGTVVGRGQLIGNVGSTGDSTGPHLHFETRVGGSAQNPYNFLP